VKDPLIDLWLTKRFKVKGDPRLVKPGKNGSRKIEKQGFSTLEASRRAK
jgi:hypothetical protein